MLMVPMVINLATKITKHKQDNASSIHFFIPVSSTADTIDYIILPSVLKMYRPLGYTAVILNYLF